jgi:hypothetical protein
MYKLRACGRSKHGFVSTELRCKVWLTILGLEITGKSNKIIPSKSQKLPESNSLIKVEIIKDQTIIKGDAERLYFCNYDTKGIDKSAFKENLVLILNELLVRNPDVRYYQGLHDIAAGFLMVLDPYSSLLSLETICKYYIQYLFFILS